MSDDPAIAGQAIYSRRFLALYDGLVYGFNSPVLWRCCKSRMVALYDDHVSARHLDVGVGSGGLLDACRFPVAAPEVTLMDMNPNSLAVTAARLGRYLPRTVQGNALEPWPVEAASFDSVALSHLVHCLPGTIPEKGRGLRARPRGTGTGRHPVRRDDPRPRRRAVPSRPPDDGGEQPPRRALQPRR